MDYQLNLFATRKRGDSLSKNNNISNNNNTYRDKFIKIRFEQKNEKKNEITKRNVSKNKNKENAKDLINSKSLRIVNNPKKSKFNNEYFEEKKINKKELPDINFLLKKNETLSKNYCLNNSENSNMFHLVLPNINLIKKEKALKYCIKKVLISCKAKKIKNS